MAGSVLGIDYSLNSPALCFYDGANPPRWWCHYKPKTKTLHPFLSSVSWSVSAPNIDDTDRHIELATWVVQCVLNENPSLIVLEDYAFAAQGRITGLAENGGVLKAFLHTQVPHVPLHIVAPTTMKKFATGSGRAQKEDVWASFIKVFPHMASWPATVFPKSKTDKINSPLSDLADAYFLADYGIQRLR